MRSCIDQAYAEHRTIHLKDIEWAASGDSQYFDVQVTPLWSRDRNLLGVSISFTDVTRSKRLQGELEQSNQELEMAYEELQSANEELQTTNEELQSANEELQSTNEELETMNEELQSSNEELQTINVEVRLRTEELNSSNAFLESVLSSLQDGVVVLDRSMRVQAWSQKAEDLWGLRSEEVGGQNFLNLDIGLPVEQLRQPLRICLAAESEYSNIMLEAINRRGKVFQCFVTCTPLIGTATEIQGIIILMSEQRDNKS